MEHNTCRENLSAYLDGELPPDEKLSLEGHLAACPECSRALGELKQVSAVFREHAMRPAPMSLKAAVFARPRERVFWSSWLKPAAALSAAAAGLLIFLNYPERPDRAAPLQEGFGSRALSIEPLGGGPAEERTQSFSGEPGKPAAAGGEAAGEPMYAAPSLARRGGYGQAKFARGALSSAGKNSGLPQWVQDRIRKYKAGPRGNPPLSVWQFDYKESTVYYLPPQCCDQYSELYDEAGRRLCAPDGGRTGGGDGKCADFYELRKNGRLVWQDPRGAR